MNTGANPAVVVRVPNSASMDHCLNDAVDRMIEVALRSRKHGILVTRLGPGHFTVELSNEVPFGRAEQLDTWNRSC